MLKHWVVTGCSCLLTTAGALAADLPARVAPPLPVPGPVFTWTGLYAGINAGYAFSGRQTVRTTGLTAFDQAVIDTGGVGAVPLVQEGVTVGGGLGYNVQIGRGSGPVIGIEADLQYTDLDRLRSAAFDFGGARFAVSGRQTLDFLGTVRGRVGYAFDRVLVYGTGGLAYGQVAYETRADISLFGGVPFDASRYSDLEVGFAYGGGIELAIPTDSFLNVLRADAVTVKVEYLRYDLGRRTLAVAGAGPVFGPGGPLAVGPTGLARFQTEGSLVRSGLNFRFGTD